MQRKSRKRNKNKGLFSFNSAVGPKKNSVPAQPLAGQKKKKGAGSTRSPAIKKKHKMILQPGL
jgi:hypothetical protein